MRASKRLVAAVAAAALGGPRSLLAQEVTLPDVATQVVRDGSIGPDASVQPTATALPEGGVRIEVGEDLGARSSDGSTLFHSFERLDVGRADEVLFSESGLATHNIIARVTGGTRSDIFGRLTSTSSAELFLLNPAGVLFGPGARVSTAGSFFLSTADRLTFADGATLDVSRDAPPPLVVRPRVVQLDFLRSTGSIVAEGGSGLDAVDIAAPDRLALLAGAPSTRIVLRSTTDDELAIRGVGVGFDNPVVPGDDTASVRLRNVHLRSTVPAPLGSSNDEAVLLIGQTISLSGTSLMTDTNAFVNLVASGALRIEDSALGIPSSSFGTAQSVSIAGDTIDVARSQIISRSFVDLGAFGPIRIADAFLGNLFSVGSETSSDPSFVRVTSRTSIGLERSGLSSTRRVGDTSIVGGVVALLAPDVAVERSNLSTSTENTPGGFMLLSGDIVIQADRVRIADGSVLTTTTGLSPLLSPTPAPGVALTDLGSRAGTISIQADDIQILGSSRLTSAAAPLMSNDTLSIVGSPGSIRLDATGRLRIEDSVLDTSIDATTRPQPGRIDISAGRVELERAIVTSAARGVEGGSIHVASSGDVVLSAAAITSSAQGPSAGGAISIAASNVQLQDGSAVVSSNTGSGPAGSIQIAGTNLSVSSASEISTEAQRGASNGLAAGSIELAVRDRVSIEGGSSVSASVVDGQGGDVTIASELLLVRDGSQVLAESAQGTGGRIHVTASLFLADPSSRVSADSGVGTDGTVEIRAPEVDLQGSLEGLPAEFLDSSALMRPTCEARTAAGETGTFYVAGERGLPTSPEEWLLALDALPAEPAPALWSAARVQQEEGAYAESVLSLKSALRQAESANDRAGVASVLGALGNAQQALGREDAAEELLTRGRSLAEGALASRLENDLGNHYAASGATARAREAYERAFVAAERSGDAVTALRSLANGARLALQAGDERGAAALLERADERAQKLPGDRAKIELLIHLGRTRSDQARRATSPEVRDAALLRAHAHLRSAAELARASEEVRLHSYALGNLAKLYQSERRWEEALVLARRALDLAQRSQASDAVYRWHWLEGQLLWAQGKAEPAVQAYRRAVQVLEESRQESRARYGSRAGFFREAVAPVYLDLADALLRGASSIGTKGGADALLVEARATVEKLKAAELRNYLRDDCAAQLESRTASLDSLARGAAVVYPIALQDRLELLVRMPSGLVRYTVPVGVAQLEAEARKLRGLVQDRTSAAYRPVARTVYDWLVRPYAAQLAAEKVETLVFVPDGALRTVPLAALHDGERFLAERFALATAPGLSLVDPRPLDLANVKPLLAGVSEGGASFAPLPSVPRELGAIRSMLGGELLLDGSFQVESLQGAVQESRPTLVHLASHAVFTGDPESSYLLTHDGRMTMDELGALLARTRYRADPVELLVLSACDTAVGDDRAALGLAGVAVRAGARSALGSLWAISDEATYKLVVSFYSHLREPGASRASALRDAQRALIASDEHGHPFYWSAFVLISNWL